MIKSYGGWLYEVWNWYARCKNADAILLRVLDRENETVILIDGGNPGDGMKIVNHIKNSIIRNLLIC